MKAYHRIKKRISGFFCRYINGTKGVISLFLAILMVPFALIVGSLINAARVNSAVAIFDEALCNASNSTLGTYDKFLRDRFGLLAMSQDTSSGWQNTDLSGGATYTAQDFISDTFAYYMEQNCQALSNTYLTTDAGAYGIYPVADTDVLFSEIQEYGKYTIPAKLVIDGLSLDDLLKNLTKSLNLVKNIFNTLSSVSGLTDGILSCDKAHKAVTEALDSLETVIKEYDSAYSSFSKEVNQYNSLIDQLKNAIQSDQAAVTKAERDVSDRQDDLDDEAGKQSALVAQLNALRNEKDAYGNKVDNSAKISAFIDSNKDALSDYLEAEDALDEAKKELKRARQKLDDDTESYRDKLDEQREKVTSAKSAYAAKIGELANAVTTAGDAVVEMQNNLASVLESGASLVKNVATNVVDFQKSAVDNDIEAATKAKEKAKTDGDEKAQKQAEEQIAALKDKKTGLSNQNTKWSVGTDTTSSALQNIDSFTSQDLKSGFNEIWYSLKAQKISVDGYVIYTDYATKLGSTASLHTAITPPLKAGDVTKLIEGLSQELVESSFFAVVETVISFVEAILSLPLPFDVALTNEVDESLYAEIGGLPSQKDRSKGSDYAFSYEDEEADHNQSVYYKMITHTYVNDSTGLTGAAAVVGQAIENITDDFNTIKECWGDIHWYNFFIQLWNILKALVDAIINACVVIDQLLLVIQTQILNKALLAGYVGYNTANRTTYDGKALSGASFSLPSLGSEGKGYAFFGAETEYVIIGNMSEIVNQTAVFGILFFLRLIYDVPLVLTNAEIQGIAVAAGAPTVGIGTVLVYILFCIGEAYMDSAILANGGTVPIIKRDVYLSPTGIPDLIEALTSLKLKDSDKTKAFDKAKDVAKKMNPDATLPKEYKPTSPKLLEQSLTLDYTKCLILMLMLTTSMDKMLNRLTDIIQMEGSYKSHSESKSYTFNLDDSYTYLRASGSFTTNEFIPIAEDPGLHSKTRIVYRGY